MSNDSLNEQQCKKDALQRVNNWLNVLEQRVVTLLSHNDFDMMSPHEREGIAHRYLILMTKLLQLRQGFASANESSGEQSLLDEFFRSLGMDETSEQYEEK